MGVFIERDVEVVLGGSVFPFFCGFFFWSVRRVQSLLLVQSFFFGLLKGLASIILWRCGAGVQLMNSSDKTAEIIVST